MKRKIILAISLVIDLLFVLRFASICEKLDDAFYFSSLNLRIKLEDAAHNDTSLPLIYTKIFHNKIVGFYFDGLGHLLRYIELNFLLNTISIIGIFGFICGLYYIARFFSHKRALLIYGSLFIFPVVEEILNLRVFFIVKALLVTGPSIIISLYGIYHFLKIPNSNRYVYIIILILMSLWWYSGFGQELSRYCFLNGRV